MSGLEGYLKRSGLEPNLLHMVKLRASQINGCAYCIDMHWKDARAVGETEQRLYGLDAWRGVALLHRPRAGRAGVDGGGDEASPTATCPTRCTTRSAAQFSEKEMADLTWAVAAINAWNRVAIASRSEAGEVHAGAARVGASSGHHQINPPAFVPLLSSYNLVTLFAKTDKANLTRAECNAVAKVLHAIKERLDRGIAYA